MNLWPEVTLEEVYAEGSRNGLTRPKSVRGAGYPMINMGELFAHERIGAIEMERVQMSERELAAFSVLKGDLLFARQSLVAAGAGKCSIVKAVAEPTTFESHLIRIRLNEQKADPSFFFYYFLSPIGKGNVQSLVMQVAAAGIRGSELAKLRVPLPPLPVQRRIADILSAYDELIENNQRRIRILEDMARSLYREWFVHFRYPDRESVPLTDSILGQIPQGWEVKKIAELLAKVSRQGKIKTQDYLQAGELPVIDQGRELVGGYTNDADVEYSGELPVIVFGDHTRILKFIDFPFACGADGTQLLRSNDERMPVSLFYYTLSAIELSDFAYARHFKFLKEELVVVPMAEVATAFSARVDPIKRQVRILQQQSDNLRRTRDLLLPRLLSRQVNLKEN